MDDEKVFRALCRASEEGRDVALATVVAARGSTPRGVGSKMVIDPERGLVGTIGGGCGEADVLEAAPDVIRHGVGRVLRVELLDSVDGWSPAVCGGVMDVLIEPVRADAGAGAGATDRAGRPAADR